MSCFSENRSNVVLSLWALLTFVRITRDVTSAHKKSHPSSDTDLVQAASPDEAFFTSRDGHSRSFSDGKSETRRQSSIVRRSCFRPRPAAILSLRRHRIGSLHFRGREADSFKHRCADQWSDLGCRGGEGEGRTAEENLWTSERREVAKKSNTSSQKASKMWVKFLFSPVKNVCFSFWWLQNNRRTLRHSPPALRKRIPQNKIFAFLLTEINFHFLSSHNLFLCNVSSEIELCVSTQESYFGSERQIEKRFFSWEFCLSKSLWGSTRWQVDKHLSLARFDQRQSQTIHPGAPKRASLWRAEKNACTSAKRDSTHDASFWWKIISCRCSLYLPGLHCGLAAHDHPPVRENAAFRGWRSARRIRWHGQGAGKTARDQDEEKVKGETGRKAAVSLNKGFSLNLAELTELRSKSWSKLFVNKRLCSCFYLLDS